MRHVILGAGGIAGMLAATLGRAGHRVTLVVRPETADRHPGTVTLRSSVFGDFAQPVELSSTAPSGADVVWVAVKATGLAAAVELVEPAQVQDAVVVPLLNGIDHLDALRRRYARVTAATIRVESHRVAPGVFSHRSPFAHVSLAARRGEPIDSRALREVSDTLRECGFGVAVSDDEISMMWDKLAFLAPIALATAALDLDLGRVRTLPVFRACQAEALAAARADGARTAHDELQRLTDAAPATMQSSMQLDVRAGREPELDAIAGAILRRSAEGTAAATAELADAVADRVAGAGAGRDASS